MTHKHTYLRSSRSGERRDVAREGINWRFDEQRFRWPNTFYGTHIRVSNYRTIRAIRRAEVDPEIAGARGCRETGSVNKVDHASKV